MMTKYTVALLALFLTILTSLSAQGTTQKVLQLLEEEMAREKIPGLQLVVMKNNQIVLSKCLGLADVAFSVPVDEQTIFSINSLAKVFAGTAIVQLAEEGKVDLSHPVSTYLEGLPAAWQGITVRQLLGHTSGLPDIEDTANGGLIGDKGDDYAWEQIQKIPVRAKPGEQFSYIATNYLLVQRIIEKQGGMPYQEFLRQKQFQIADMDAIHYGSSYEVMRNKSSTYSYYRKDKLIQNYVQGEQLLEISEEFSQMLWADAGAFSTALNMIKWIQALQTGKFFKKKESLALLWEAVPLNNGEYRGFGGFLTAYALGWPVIQRAEHPGVAPIGGGRASFIIYPDDELTILLFTNLTGSSPQKIIEKLAALYWSN